MGKKPRQLGFFFFFLFLLHADNVLEKKERLREKIREKSRELFYYLITCTNTKGRSLFIGKVTS